MRCEWKEELAEVFCDSVRDGTHDSPKQTADKNGKYLITSKHLNDYYLDFRNAYTISVADYKKVIERSKVDQWDILFSMIGTIGRIYQEKSPLPDYAIKNVGLFKMGGNQQKSEWLKHYLRSPQAKAYIRAQLRGSTQSYVPLNALRKMPISYPPLGIQCTIAATLSCIDDKIELNNKINANLEAQAQAIFKSWFVDFEPFQDGEFVDSELGPIPKGWRVGKFTDVVDVLGGGTPKTGWPEYWDGSIPFFTPKDANGLYTLSTEKYLSGKGVENCNSRIYPVNTVFITARGTVGKIALAGVDMAMNQSCYALQGKTGYGQFFILALAQKMVASLRHKSSGAVFNAIVTRDFSSEHIVIPDHGNIEQYQQLMTPIYSLLLENTKQSRTLATLRDTLLPKLMSGEIEVPTAEVTPS